jgi:hypothetical protein
MDDITLNVLIYITMGIIVVLSVMPRARRHR